MQSRPRPGRRPRSAAAGGVRFGAAVPPAPGEGSDGGSEDGVAEVRARKNTRHGTGMSSADLTSSCPHLYTTPP
jgi:hypothetical protein